MNMDGRVLRPNARPIVGRLRTGGAAMSGKLPPGPHRWGRKGPTLHRRSYSRETRKGEELSGKKGEEKAGHILKRKSGRWEKGQNAGVDLSRDQIAHRSKSVKGEIAAFLRSGCWGQSAKGPGTGCGHSPSSVPSKRKETFEKNPGGCHSPETILWAREMHQFFRGGVTMRLRHRHALGI